ncbi:hypothetical protein AMATHDRAFT_62141 [Amanita thiersii Skay4041]|uniref:NADP-dependent oxidoreductase domain-containing protein n=1 Tax=Amanita thiersii Skay4041 TaxID=703135 RepID=A0A2A9NQL0_9AGAR|nr:hypothetical protein AMATHDRAFT_62141 [Amanita thiersii Skay4041]
MPFGSVALNDGYSIPAIAYGTGSTMKGRDVTEYVEQALESGFSHIDTAQVYGTEESTGKAIKESGLHRSDLFVTSKYLRGDIQQVIRDSLSKLGLEYLDLYLIHSPQFIHNMQETWTEFEKIKETGLSRSIGVSNFNVEHLESLIKVARIKPSVNQILLHPYNYKEMKPVLQFAKKNNIVIEAYSTLTPITKFPGGPVDEPVFSAAARRRGVKPSQILLAWARAKGAVVVTTSRSKQHLQEYLSSADIKPLTDEEIAAIDAAGEKNPESSISQSKQLKEIAGIILRIVLLFIMTFILFRQWI